MRFSRVFVHTRVRLLDQDQHNIIYECEYQVYFYMVLVNKSTNIKVYILHQMHLNAL